MDQPSSIMQTTPGIPLRVSVIRRWKCSGAEVIPKVSLWKLHRHLRLPLTNLVGNLQRTCLQVEVHVVRPSECAAWCTQDWFADLLPHLLSDHLCRCGDQLESYLFQSSRAMGCCSERIQWRQGMKWLSQRDGLGLGILPHSLLQTDTQTGSGLFFHTFCK